MQSDRCRAVFLPSINRNRCRRRDKSLTELKSRFPVHFQTSPKYTFGSSSGRTDFGSYYNYTGNTPGPGAYNVQQYRQGPSFSFSGRTYIPFGSKLDNPGPGAHNVLHSTGKNCHKIGPSFGCRHSEKIAVWTDRDIANRELGYSTLKQRGRERLPPLLTARGNKNLGNAVTKSKIPSSAKNLPLSDDFWKGYRSAMLKHSLKSSGN